VFNEAIHHVVEMDPLSTREESIRMRMLDEGAEVLRPTKALDLPRLRLELLRNAQTLSKSKQSLGPICQQLEYDVYLRDEDRERETSLLHPRIEAGKPKRPVVRSAGV
jgi:hypothetical protein